MRTTTPHVSRRRGATLSGLLILIGVPAAAGLTWTATLTDMTHVLPPSAAPRALADALREARAASARDESIADLSASMPGPADGAAAGSGAHPPEPCGWFGPSFRLGAPQFQQPTEPGDRELVQHVVRKRVDEVAGCYEERSLQAPAVHGVVVVELEIALDGDVVTADLIDAERAPDPTTARCIVGTLRTWRFPALSGRDALIVRYPFMLSPRR